MHSSPADERALVEAMNAAITAEYVALANAAGDVGAQATEEPAALRRASTDWAGCWLRPKPVTTSEPPGDGRRSRP